MEHERFLAGGHQLDARADRRSIGFLANELDGQPVVALAGVLEENIVVSVAVDGTAGLDEKIDVAVAVPVAAGDSVALLKVAGAGRLAVISANRVPPTFLNMRLGTSVAMLGSPVPRYMSRKPSLSKSA